jgi:menaquinone-dependent protoporphyrinogen IX oxidase
MTGGILYKSKYGSTLQYAEWLSEQLHLPILDIDKVSIESVTLHDFFVIGSPVYIGKLMIAAWLKKHERILQNKKLFLFIVCATPASNTEKLEEISRKNIPASLVANSTVFFLQGRISRENLSWLDRMLLKVGAKAESDPSLKRSMLEDFDHVHIENLDKLINAIHSIEKPVKLRGELLHA